MDDGRKIAVVLFNLGGPDSPDAVRPFLFNLFNDPAIIEAPGPVRWALAQYISRRRAATARANYANMGGASPLLPNTQKQAQALQAALAGDAEVRCFIAMRYWHPFADETARDVKAFGPDKVILLPLYPQYSAATSGSSLEDWRRAARGIGLDTPTSAVCCYPDLPGFIETVADMTAEAWIRAARAGTPRILLSAHGLPRRNIAAGDPYQWQVERSAAAIAAAVAQRLEREPDWLVTYQSRVGRLQWIEPYTENEVERGAMEGRPLVVVPLAFVSEHVETLVELDIEYRDVAERHGAPGYERVGTVSEESRFIEGLAGLVRGAIAGAPGVESGDGGRLCPGEWSRCACAAAEGDGDG